MNSRHVRKKYRSGFNNCVEYAASRSHLPHSVVGALVLDFFHEFVTQMGRGKVVIIPNVGTFGVYQKRLKRRIGKRWVTVRKTRRDVIYVSARSLKHYVELGAFDPECSDFMYSRHREQHRQDYLGCSIPDGHSELELQRALHLREAEKLGFISEVAYDESILERSARPRKKR